MPKRSRKRHANEIAKSIVDQVAGIGRNVTVDHGFERTAKGSALS